MEILAEDIGGGMMSGLSLDLSDVGEEWPLIPLPDG